MPSYRKYKTINVPVYDPTGVYEKYDFVYVPTGINSGRHFILKADSSYFNLNNFNYNGVIDYNGWYNVNHSGSTINDIFEFNYEQSADLSVTNTPISLAEGYNQSINTVGFNPDTYKCKMAGAGQKEAGALIAYMEVRGYLSGFYFRAEGQEDNVNKYAAQGLEISENYNNYYDINFSLVRNFKEDGVFTSNQPYSPPGISGKYDLMDYADTVTDFNQLADGTYYNVDTGNYAMVISFTINSSTSSFDDFSGGENVDFLIYTLADLKNMQAAGSISLNRTQGAINAKYVDLAYYNLNSNALYEPSDYSGYIDIVNGNLSYHKNVFSSPYSFLTAPLAGEYNTTIFHFVPATTLGSTRLNKADYLTVPLTTKYLSVGRIAGGYETNPNNPSFSHRSWEASEINNVTIKTRLFRKNTPTSNQADSTLVATVSNTFTIMAEEKRKNFELRVKTSDVGDFSKINLLILDKPPL